MPLTNGDVSSNTRKILRNSDMVDPQQANEFLKQESIDRDGLDVDTLVDSNKHGALTYNDFLVLPGYIGT